MAKNAPWVSASSDDLACYSGQGTKPSRHRHPPWMHGACSTPGFLGFVSTFFDVVVVLFYDVERNQVDSTVSQIDLVITIKAQVTADELATLVAIRLRPALLGARKTT